jgi:hypothetical protein
VDKSPKPLSNNNIPTPSTLLMAFLKCYNFLFFKIFFTKGIDINTLQTQEFVNTWLVKIFINCKNL